MHDYIMMVLQFIHDLIGAYMMWSYELGPIAILIFWPFWISIYYVLYKVFCDWPLDYRAWRAGGIGKCSISTDDFYR